MRVLVTVVTGLRPLVFRDGCPQPLENTVTLCKQYSGKLEGNSIMSPWILSSLVCRILNKITPDNFDKLSYELTQLPAVNSKEALKGVILLVSDPVLSVLVE